MATTFCDAIAIIKRHRGAFVVLNMVFYGLVALSMVATLHIPELQAPYKPSTEQAFAHPGLFKTVADAYANRNLLLAISLTFLVNLIIAAFGMTTLPSFALPFVGILAQFYRAFLWGVLFAPIGPLRVTLIPHSLTLLVEGQAHVLAAFAAYVQARMFLWPHRYGLNSHKAGYKAGVLSTLKLYSLIVLALLLGAVYEVVESVYFMPLLLRH
ncbi:hypothetical protein [Paraburkholderia sp. J11-2]|uniref:hypothetical protein n=1 Tax=Paraburkholderia sp. J11-2 TaxID=2805431 RepID=UPI002AB62F20|nr:hypothetical protein [Paraburkholderia sp. J11-2]